MVRVGLYLGGVVVLAEGVLLRLCGFFVLFLSGVCLGCGW